MDLGPVYPLLKSAEWPGKERSITRPLLPGLKFATMPLVSYCYLKSPLKAFVGPERLKVIKTDAETIATVALSNLGNVRNALSLTEVNLPSGGKLEVVSGPDDPFAVERILHGALMRHLQEKVFKTKLLAVAIPARPFFLAAPAESALDGRLLEVARWAYDRAGGSPDDKLTPEVFVLDGGKLCGRVTEIDGKRAIDVVV